MSDIAIRCDHLSKQYRIGERESYKALRDVITDSAASPFRRLRSALRNGSANSNGSHSALSTQHSALSAADSALSTQHSALAPEIRNPNSEIRNSFWALDDVSFEVKRGEVVGIIGRNGAGKSTLLKILSRITKPTKGHAEIHGRVGSLLEVGTGFHPELTGRENIYLNAAILGMRRAEVEKKFDEIVAFAEVERFIDTPVKRYSSGMYVRLAFAVAAHMETEVLLVDEVLAVGDAQFQKKCLGKMGDVAKQGRAVLFVSHTMGAIELLCPRAILIVDGSISSDGECRSVITNYLAELPNYGDSAIIDLRNHPNRSFKAARLLSSMEILNSEGIYTKKFLPGDDIVLQFRLDPEIAIKNPTLGVGVDNARGQRVFSVGTYFSDHDWTCLDRPTTVTCKIPSITLLPGIYSVGVSVGDSYDTLMDVVMPATDFSVEACDYFGTGRLPSSDMGIVLAASEWQFSETLT